MRSTCLPAARATPQPVLLWLHPAPPLPAGRGRGRTAMTQNSDAPRPSNANSRISLRRQAERVEKPEQDRGLVTVRMENIFTWGEFVKVDRGAEDDEDLDACRGDAARSIDRFGVTRDGKRAAATLQFDLDLPSEAEDDQAIGEGIRVPEWDWKAQRLQPEHCRIQPMLAADARGG